MKKMFLAAMLLLGMSILLSCKQQPIQEELDDDIVLVGVSVSYENLGFVNEEPLSKAAEPNGIYGIQVREYIDINDIHNSSKYCYGLFDDISKLEIQFKKNHKYFIRIDYFPNGKNELPIMSNGYSPLQIEPWHLVTNVVLNTIFYTSEFDLAFIGSTTEGDYDRYMYWNEGFVPTDNSPLPVHFLRMNAGLIFLLEKVEGYSYDNVLVCLTDWGKKYQTAITDGDNRITIDKITLGVGVWGEGIPELYDYEIEIGTAESPSLFYKGKIEIKRNTMRTYNVKLESDLTTNPMNFSYESDKYEEDNGGYLN